MNLTCLIFGFVFLTAGLLFAAGKLHGYIRAWQDMPNEEKRRIKIGPLCRNIGAMIALAGVLFLLSGSCRIIREHFFVLSMVIWLILAGIDLYIIEKKHRYEID